MFFKLRVFIIFIQKTTYQCIFAFPNTFAIPIILILLSPIDLIFLKAIRSRTMLLYKIRDFETSFIVSSGPNLLSESMNYILVLPCGLSGKSSRDYLENDLLSRTSREHACDLLAKIAIPRAFIRRKSLRNLNPKKLNTTLIRIFSFFIKTSVLFLSHICLLVLLSV